MLNMASRKAFNALRNLPVKTVQAYEGTLTRYTTSVSPMGGTNEGAAVYSAPIKKGDLVTVYVHTEQGNIIVEKKVAANDTADHAIGFAISDPQGIDNTTVSGGTPADGLRRLVDVAFFGLAVVEMEAGGALIPGNGAGYSETEVQCLVDTGAVGVSGRMVNLGHFHDGDIAAVLVGYAGLNPAD